MSLHAITIVGHDRPGIIAEATGALAHVGLNLTDSTMTILRGHFSMMLVSSGDASTEAITDAMQAVTASGRLFVSVQPVPEETLPSVGVSSWILTVHGGDRPGIVSAVAAEVAAVGGNFTDLTTRLAGDLYLLVGEVDLPLTVNAVDLESRLRDVATGLGVSATLHAADADEL